MFNRKFIAIALSMLCLTACSANNDIQQTSMSETTTTVTSSAETTASIVTEAVTTTEITTEEVVEETTETAEDRWRNPEDGLVFFVQPSICQRDEESRVDDWKCRDTEVLRDFHWDGEWWYTKELIFAFSNFTDKPVTIDNLQIIRMADSEPMKFTDGSDVLNIDFTVQSLHKTDYLLKAESFDYSACESGIYKAVATFGDESYEQEFFINNCGIHTENHISENNTYILLP